eukprot:GEMP01075492.1.p1 GENE.GEMP01075492.1~~GEMP01075492.1.p1  ORF type:complete len:155 (+),score=20.85 GEMP01075492.1:65-529(+)
MAIRNVRLIYFDFPGIAEATRIALHAANINFEDVRVKHSDFKHGTMKPTLPFGMLPILEFDDMRFCQAGAIMRFAGRLSKLYPEDAVQALKVDEVLGINNDIRARIHPAVFEADYEKKMAMRDKLAKETLPEWFGKFDKFLAAKDTTLCGRLAA